MINLTVSYPHKTIIDKKVKAHPELADILLPPCTVWTNGLDKALSSGSSLDITNGLESYLNFCKKLEITWKPYLNTQTKFYSTIKEEYPTRIISDTITPCIQRLNELMAQKNISEPIDLVVGPTTGVISYKCSPESLFKDYWETKDFDTGIFLRKEGKYYPLFVGEIKGYVDKTMADSISATTNSMRSFYCGRVPHFTAAEDDARGSDVGAHSDLPNLHFLTASKRQHSKTRNPLNHPANDRFIIFLQDTSKAVMKTIEKYILER